jgi:DNA-binding CsgD family transcriptional regulator
MNTSLSSLWIEGVKIQAIAARLGISIATVHTKVKRLGLPCRYTKRRHLRRLIRKHVEQGDTDDWIAAQLEICTPYVGRIRRQLGLKSNGRRGPKPKQQCKP